MRRVSLALTLLGLIAGCGTQTERNPPNVLWILWDTVRADRLGLYGNPRSTTPFVDRWARQARIYDNCLSIASTTVPAHASMFTDRLALEHGADNTYCLLPESLETLPEIFRLHGYQTYLYSENPFITRETGFGQGFDSVAVPWEARWRSRAAEIIEQKIPMTYRNPQLSQLLRQEGIPPWALSPCGILGEEVLCNWLEHRDRSRPYFAFLNFMEAHAPIITPARYRSAMLAPADVHRSYAMNLTPAAIWRYTFRLQDFSAEELEVIRGTYDASLREMDDIVQTLLTRLEKSGALQNTIVILCSDHGELLGEHHMLDHQYSLAEPLLRVPLVLHYPPAVKRGRESRPVMNLDLYPTLLELAGIDVARRPQSLSISLLAPVEDRTRIAEFPTPPLPPYEEARKVNPAFDPTPFHRSLRAIRAGTLKFIWSSDGRNALYDLGTDPGELHDRLAQDPQRGADLADRLERIVTARQPPGRAEPLRARLTPEQEDVLRSLGYLGSANVPSAGAPAESTPAAEKPR